MPPSPRSFDEKRSRIAALPTVPAAVAEAELRIVEPMLPTGRIEAIFLDRFGS